MSDTETVDTVNDHPEAPTKTARVTLPCPDCGGAGNVHANVGDKINVVSPCDNCAGAGKITFTVTPE